MTAPDVRCDVLVVGSGGAGMSAAIAAREAGASVIVITKSALGASNTGRAQGGIQAALAADDSTEDHFEDTFAAGHDDGDPAPVRTLVEGGPDAIAWLASIGVPFTRDDGDLRIIRCGGARRPRLLQAGERTGAEMVQAMRAAVRGSGAEVRESTALEDQQPVEGGWTATTRAKDGAASAFAVTGFAAPIWRAMKRRADGSLSLVWPEYRDTRSQDLPETFHDAGQFYWVPVADFLDAPALLTDRSRGVVFERWRAHDIDTEEDWMRAEAMFRTLKPGAA